MTYLLDVNVLIALAWPNHVHHADATRWFAEVHESGWATTPMTESGFVRISSNARVFPEGVTPGQAAEVLGRYCALPGHEFWADTTRLSERSASLADHVHGSGWVTDAHLALVAAAYGGSLATFDSRAAGLAQDLGAQSVLLEA